MDTGHKSILLKPVVLFLYIVISLIVTYPAVVHLSTSSIGHGSDPELFMWFMKWVQYAVWHFQNPLVSNHILFPGGVNLMWNSSVLLAAFILSPVTSQLGVILAYNIMVISALFLSAFAAYLATLRFVHSRGAAFLSGLIYGFSPYMIAQTLGHPHLTLAFIPPLLVWLGYDVAVSRQIGARQSGILLGIFLFCQLLLGEELLASEAIIVAFAVAVSALLNRKDTKQHYTYAVKVFLTGIPVFFLLSLPFFYVQFAGPARPAGLLQPQNVFVTDLLNFIVPGPFQLLKTGKTLSLVSKFTGNASEWDGYLGLPFLLIVLYTVIKRHKDKSIKFLAWMTLIAAIASLGPYLHVNGHATHVYMPWILFGSLPLLKHLLPCRFALYMFLFSGILIALFVENMVTQQKSRNFTAYAFLTLGLVFLMPVFPASPYPVQQQSIPAFFTTPAIQRHIPKNSTVFIVPVSRGAEGTAMLWQAASDMWFRMPEGYAINSHGFGPAPSLFTNIIQSIGDGGKLPPLDPGMYAAIFGYLHYHHIRYILVGPAKNQKAVISFLTTLMGKSPMRYDGVSVWPADQISSRPGYFISGDKYSTYYKKMDWIGKQIELTTYDVAVEIQISGIWLHNGTPIDISVSSNKILQGSTVPEQHYRITTTTTLKLTIPKNSFTKITAQHTWVPDRYIHNGDKRNLSVLFMVEGIHGGETK